MGPCGLPTWQNPSWTWFVGDRSIATGYTYESEIDSETYNKIKLVRDNKTTGKRDVYIFQDSNNMTFWGVLQDYETVQEGMNEAQIKERGRPNAGAVQPPQEIL